jgi:acylphosphatase
VQGVYFRASTVEQALRLGVTGWIKNCQDGSVEIVAEGSIKPLEDLIAWCRCGPDGARVERLDLGWEDFRSEFDRFFVKRAC